MTTKISAAVALVGALLWVVGAATSPAQTTERVSVSSAGEQGNGDSYAGPASWSVSANGRFVAFYSYATNLVSGDTNARGDIFVRDRRTGVTERVSVDSAGVQGNDHSSYPSISADGRYVAFQSYADDLVSGDTSGQADVFVHDRQTGITERVSIDSAGNEGNGTSDFPSISANGRYVAFWSYATNLVPGDTNNSFDVFVHDRQTGITERVSVDSAGGQGNNGSRDPSISANGRYVAFWSYATNLGCGVKVTEIFVYDRETGITECTSVNSEGSPGNRFSARPSISAEGRYVVFDSQASNLVPGDTNGVSDVFLRDRCLFCDGFESGDTSAWSAAQP